MPTSTGGNIESDSLEEEEEEENGIGSLKSDVLYTSSPVEANDEG